MKENYIKVTDFTILPGARHRNDGDGSADQFFEEYIEEELKKALLDKKDKVYIDLDGTLGYASSFVSQLAERIKNTCKKKRIVRKKVVIKSNDDPWQKDRFWHEVEQ